MSFRALTSSSRRFVSVAAFHGIGERRALLLRERVCFVCLLASSLRGNFEFPPKFNVKDPRIESKAQPIPVKNVIQVSEHFTTGFGASRINRDRADEQR